MATHPKVPAWIQRRISERPVARWISWNVGRPREGEAAAQLSLPSVPPDYSDNIVYLFPRSA